MRIRRNTSNSLLYRHHIVRLQDVQRACPIVGRDQNNRPHAPHAGFRVDPLRAQEFLGLFQIQDIDTGNLLAYHLGLWAGRLGTGFTRASRLARRAQSGSASPLPLLLKNVPEFAPHHGRRVGDGAGYDGRSRRAGDDMDDAVVPFTYSRPVSPAEGFIGAAGGEG